MLIINLCVVLIYCAVIFFLIQFDKTNVFLKLWLCFSNSLKYFFFFLLLKDSWKSMGLKYILWRLAWTVLECLEYFRKSCSDLLCCPKFLSMFCFRFAMWNIFYLYGALEGSKEPFLMKGLALALFML